MQGKGMAILLAPKSGGKEEPSEYEGEESVADSVEFSEMFDAFCEAANIKPKDTESARRRLYALFCISADGRGY